MKTSNLTLCCLNSLQTSGEQSLDGIHHSAFCHCDKANSKAPLKLAHAWFSFATYNPVTNLVEKFLDSSVPRSQQLATGPLPELEKKRN
jgi:hypothetical protein